MSKHAKQVSKSSKKNSTKTDIKNNLDALFKSKASKKIVKKT